MYLNHKPYILSALSKRQLIWEIETNEKIIFLTFDDGPIPQVTPKVIEKLEEYNAKASFFMVGDNAFKHHDVFKLVKDSGHTIGNHSNNHLNSWQTPLLDYYKNIELANTILESEYFRPPYGRIRIKNIPMLNKQYKIVMWSVLSGDFDQSCSPQKCFEKIQKYTGFGSIIVMHDSLKAEKNMLYCLEKTLDLYSQQGFRFLSLDQYFISQKTDSNL